MFQAWATRLSDAVNQKVQSALRELVLSFAIILLVALAFLWGTIAAYLYLVQELGSVKAAGLVAGLYAVLAILLMIIKASSAKSTIPLASPRVMSTPMGKPTGTSAPGEAAANFGASTPNMGSDSIDAFFKAVTSNTGDQEPQVMEAATEALRTLSPVERLGMLAVMGFLAGRKMKR